MRGRACIDDPLFFNRSADGARPVHPIRSVRAQFGHTACMGLFLSRGFSAARSFLPFFIFLVPILSFDLRREHSSAPTANLTGGRAQGRSRMAVTPTLPSTPLLPGHSLTGPSTAACCGDRVRLD